MTNQILHSAIIFNPCVELGTACFKQTADIWNYARKRINRFLHDKL